MTQRVTSSSGESSPRLRTFSGFRIYYTNPEASTFTIADIAHALSQVPRFVGQLPTPYSVAQHSIHVVRVLQAWGAPLSAQRLGLVHDASEAYMNDLPRDLKHMPELAGYRAIEARLMRAILDHFSLKPSAEDQRIVKLADDASGSIEMGLWEQHIVRLPYGTPKIPAHLMHVTSQTYADVRAEFIDTYSELGCF